MVAEKVQRYEADPAGPASATDVLIRVAQLLEESVAVQRHLLSCMSALSEGTALFSNAGSDSVSSISIEDLAKGDPKITTKLYPPAPLTREDIDRALANHAYAHRRAAEMALNGWTETVEAT